MFGKLLFAGAGACVALSIGMAGATPASAQATRQIYFTNACDRPIQIFVHFTDRPGNWRTNGWFKFRPGQGAYITSNGTRLTQLEDRRMYFYAETTDSGSTLRWQNGSAPKSVRFQGGTYNARQANYSINDSGDYFMRITCD